MIFKNETLDALTDEQVQSVVSYGQALLKTRKDKRIETATEAYRAAMRAEGITLTAKDLRAGGMKAVKAIGSSYKAGTHYQHPDDTKLTWNGKGQKPNWIRDLEAAGKKPVEAAA